jgi:hypothetical protein
VETIRLPRHLPDRPKLALLNERMKAGDIKLDWTDVAPEVAALDDVAETLATLFAGLNLADHIKIIGAETIPEPLMPAILEAFEAVEASASNREDASNAMTNDDITGNAPALWLPEHSSDQEEFSSTNSEESVGARLIAPRGLGDGEIVGRDQSGPYATADASLGSGFLDVQNNEQHAESTDSSISVILTPPSSSRLRDELEAMVIRDLLGPAAGPDEELTEDRVRDRYLIGMLAPEKEQTVPEEQDELGIAEEGSDEEGPIDMAASQIASLSPSSLGMSFCVDRDATTLLVTVRWGHYQRAEREVQKATKGASRLFWRRTQREATQEFALKEGVIAPWHPENEAQPDVYVKGIVRRSAGNWTVTLFLVNGQKEPKRLRDEAWLFQPELIVEAPGGAPIFQRRPSEQQNRYSTEERSMAMLYRRYVGFAVGHGIGVHAETLPGDPTCAVRLSTRVVPSYDVPQTEAPTIAEVPALADLTLDMKTLAEASQASLHNHLQPLITAYATWIEQQAARIDDPAAGLAAYRNVAVDALAKCRGTLERINSGIRLLASSDEAARAFAFMNRAMWQQRIHTLYAEAKRRGQLSDALSFEDLDQPVNRSWRPFQLAFILLNLPALTDLHHPDRGEESSAIADLLWFPTGGGKTEAYLGLTAYTLAIRRLQGIIAGRSGEDGVAVIMRYTLRLLTLQQFQRASSLICACEMIRREDTSGLWGETPFRLGLWVGQRSTPNTTEESEEANKQEHGMYNSAFGGVGSPRQLTSCPWCGSPIDGGKNIEVERVERGRGRTISYCSDPYGQCPFSKAKAPGEGLPVVVVDEEIYRLLPALLIATVDKFAQLPWKGATQMLFGQVDKECSRHGFRSPDLDDKDTHPAIGKWPRARSSEHAPLRPPDLIIQDELHLISGPLGTLVGLYETVIDHLATWEVDGQKVRPKVIAATATIRRASEQMHALFLRQVNIFPPQGLDVEDNFFARQRPPSEMVPGRRYIGICANGRRIKAALIRVYVAHLSAAQMLYNKYGAAADPWMTLVGYFNSMRELGGMRRLVDDDVSSRLWKMEERGMAKRSKPFVEELTSRKSSTVIPDVLGRLELGFGSPDGSRPIDVLLATNMISVGVDVRRLGLMVVTDQPKTTAEYIQATSRVGRAAPGLVCVVFNWARPRDLSHYEQFEHYHATFYQQVEALSVTPFAPRALDRGLAALLTSYVRLSGTEFSRNDAAGNVTNPDAIAYFEEAFNDITRRAEEVTYNGEAAERVLKALEKLKSFWLHKASMLPNLGYKPRNDGKTQGLLHDPERGQWKPFTCLNSLRDVEPTVNLILDERGLGDSEFDMPEEPSPAEEVQA